MWAGSFQSSEAPYGLMPIADGRSFRNIKINGTITNAATATVMETDFLP